jgi:acetolactate synthase I/III small subunit
MADRGRGVRAPDSAWPGKGGSENKKSRSRARQASEAAAKTNEVLEHTFSVLVDNEAGVLHRVVGLFSGRGYNIESLTVSEVDEDQHLSKITVVTSGTPQIIDQIRAQLDRLVPVHRVANLTTDGPSVQREMGLIKVVGSGEARVEALRIADIFRAQVVDSTNRSFVFEITGSSDKLDAFIDLMKPLGLADVSRTGIVAIARGDGAM